MRIPLGAKPPVSNMWNKCIGIAFVIFVIWLLTMMFSPSLTVLVEVGVFLLILVVAVTICLGLVNSAREALQYADQ